VYKSWGAVLLCSLLAACGAPKSRPLPPPHGTLAPAPPPGAPVYRVDPEQSELKLLIYRAGPMAALGHNHVIVNRALGGRVVYAGSAADAEISLTVPTAGFVIDDERARGEEGADFAEAVPQEAKAGTLHNMLSAALLDAGEFPEITLNSLSISGTGSALEARFSVSVAGHESTLVVPFNAEVAPERLTAGGAITLRQSALGLAPFSALLGALRVQDEMRVKFRVVARAD
jgi:hypothetical protein